MLINNRNSFFSSFAFSVLAIWFLVMVPSFGYSSSLFQDEEKAQVRIDLNYFKMGEDSCYLTVEVRTRQERQYVPVSGVIINLFLNEQTKLGMMGNITTDQEGQGTFILPDKFYQAKDTLTTLTLMARLKNDPHYQDRTTSLEIKDAIISINQDDSLQQVTMRLMEQDSAGNMVPVEGANIKFYVKRLFSLLPVGEEYNITDDNGEVTIDFPKDLPGDAAKNIELVVGLEEDDNYGNVFVTSILPWGSDALKHANSYDERTMWASRDKTPIFLLVFPNLILLVVWGIIICLIVQLVKISMDSKPSEVVDS
jgi:hypothetical protein